MIGEGYHKAISQRGFFHLGRWKAYLARLEYRFKFYNAQNKFIFCLENTSAVTAGSDDGGMSPEELWVFYYKAYLDMDYVLRRYPKLCKFLWEIGETGVSDKEYDEIVKRLPREYKELVSNNFVYETSPIDSLSAYEKIIKGRGYFKEHRTFFIENAICRKVAHKLYKLLSILGA